MLATKPSFVLAASGTQFNSPQSAMHACLFFFVLLWCVAWCVALMLLRMFVLPYNGLVTFLWKGPVPLLAHATCVGTALRNSLKMLYRSGLHVKAVGCKCVD